MYAARQALENPKLKNMTKLNIKGSNYMHKPFLFQQQENT